MILLTYSYNSPVTFYFVDIRRELKSLSFGSFYHQHSNIQYEYTVFVVLETQGSVLTKPGCGKHIQSRILGLNGHPQRAQSGNKYKLDV